MLQRHPEGRRRLAGQRTSAKIGDGTTDHDGHYGETITERSIDRGVACEFRDGLHGGLRIEGVKDGLNQQEVNAPFHKSKDLLFVCITYLGKGYGAVSGVVDVR